jgi:hypothetical protein
MSPTQRIADRFIICNPEQDLLARGSMGDGTSILPNDRPARAPREGKRRDDWYGS